jgi:hypothetical protein
MMKKIFLVCMICMSFGVTKLHAQQTDTAGRVRFFYFPTSNVYMNTSDNSYWYYDESASRWTSANTLPSAIHLRKTPRYTVYYGNTDVWKENEAHVKKYKVKKNGTVKQKD